MKNLKNYRNYIEQYLTKKRKNFDRFNEKSAYFEFFKEIKPEYFQHFDNIPNANDIGYKSFLEQQDWNIISEGIDGFFKTLHSDLTNRYENGDKLTEEEILLKKDIERFEGVDSEDNSKKTNTTTNKNFVWLLLIGIAIYYFFLKK